MNKNPFYQQLLNESNSRIGTPDGVSARFGDCDCEVLPVHHIHVKYGDEIHTIAHKGDCVDFRFLFNLMTDIILNSKEFRDANVEA